MRLLELLFQGDGLAWAAVGVIALLVLSGVLLGVGVPWIATHVYIGAPK